MDLDLTPEEAAPWLSCWICGLPLHAHGKAWSFRCQAGHRMCAVDIGETKRSVRSMMRGAIRERMTHG